jgi:hypothetical protein
VIADELPADKSSRPDPLSILWHFLAAPQALLALLALLLLTLVAALLIPQLPLSARGDALQWLATQPSLAGSGLVRGLRLYDLAHSFWLRLLLGLLAALLLVRLAEAAELAWRAARAAGFDTASFRFFSTAARREQLSSAPPAEAEQEARQRFAGSRGRWSAVAGSEASTHVAIRRARALWAAPVAYVGLLAALVGALVLVTWGWQSEAWQPRQGEEQAVGPAGNAIVRLEGFALKRDAAGRVLAATSQVSWRRGEASLGRSSLSVWRPAFLQGLAVRQLGYLPVLSLHGTDEAGHPLLQEKGASPGLPSDVQVLFPDASARPVLFLDQDRLLVLSYEPAGREGKPALHLALAASDGTGQVPLGTLYQSGSVTFDGSRLDVDLSFRPLLRADHLPGAALTLAGLTLALAALALHWLARPALTWIAAVPEDPGITRLHMAALHPLLSGAGPEGGEREGHGEGFHTAVWLAFLLLGAAALAGAAWGWWTAGSFSGSALPARWLAAGTLLAAIGLLAWPAS